MRHLSRVLTVLTATVAALALATGPALASNAHFIKPSASLSGYDLRVSFKEAGLGAGSVETVRARADYTAVFQCINGGGKNPSAGNKTEISGSATASGTFTADKNGNISGTLTVQAPSLTNNNFSCPGGQKEQLSMITWTNVGLDDLTSGASATFPGTFTVGTVI